MALTKFNFRPGIVRDVTPYSNEGGWYACDKVRFKRGMPETIGGWVRVSDDTFLGVCRSLWSWVTLRSRKYVGIGTHLKHYILYSTKYYDITPVRRTTTLTNPFTAVSGQSEITVYDVGHGAAKGDYVTFSGADLTGLGGTVTAAVLQITRAVSSVIDADHYKVDVGVAATAADAAGSPGGGGVAVQYDIAPGFELQGVLAGWGVGWWSEGPWGGGSVGSETSSRKLRVWSQSNFGEDYIYGPREGELYYWDASVGTTPMPFTVSIASPAIVTVANGVEITPGTPLMFMSSGALPTGLVAGTVYYAKNINLNTFEVAATEFGVSINTSGTQSGHHYISCRGLPLRATGDGDTPRVQNKTLVSDASRFVMCFGVNDYGSDKMDPLLIRWAHQEDPYTWTPSATNQAGSIRLSNGSFIVTAVQTRQEFVVFTDTAVYSMQYVGPPYVWSTQLVGTGMTIMGYNCATVAAGRVFWVGRGQFYTYDGRVVPLDCPVQRHVFNDISSTQYDQVYCAANEAFNEVWWFYCAKDSTRVNRYVVFNYVENLWFYGTMPRTAWLDVGIFTTPLATTYNGKTVQHEVGTDDLETPTPQPLNAYVTTSELDLADGNQYGYMWRILPDLTFEGSAPVGGVYAVPKCTLTVYPMQNSGSDVLPFTADSADVTKTATYSVMEAYTGQVFIRVRGRQFMFKVASNQIGTKWRLGMPRFDVRTDGRR